MSIPMFLLTLLLNAILILGFKLLDTSRPTTGVLKWEYFLDEFA